MSNLQRPKPKGMTVLVKDGNVEKALRKFKSKIQDSGKLEELREREHYTKPTTQRRIAKSKGRHRYMKQLEAEELNGKRVSGNGNRRNRLF